MTVDVSKTSNLELAFIDQGDPFELGATDRHMRWVESRLFALICLILSIRPQHLISVGNFLLPVFILASLMPNLSCFVIWLAITLLKSLFTHF